MSDKISGIGKQASSSPYSLSGPGGVEPRGIVPDSRDGGQPQEEVYQRHHNRVVDFLAAKLRRLSHGPGHKPDPGPLPPELQVRELKGEDLRRVLSPQEFGSISSTNHFPRAGQERLLSALQIASGIRTGGYNVFLTRFDGEPEMVVDLLKNFPPLKTNPKDYAYVRNFEDANTPVLMIFEPGKAKAFKEIMEATIESLAEDLPKLKGESDFARSQVEIEERATGRVKALRQELEQKAGEVGFGVLEGGHGEEGAGSIGIRLMLPVLEENKGGLSESGKPQPVTLPFDVLDKIAAKMEKGSTPKALIAPGVTALAFSPGGTPGKPVFVLTETESGKAYEVMTKPDYDKKVAIGKASPEYFELEDLHAQYSELHVKIHEMGAANELAAVEAGKNMNQLYKEKASVYIDKAFQPVRESFNNSDPKFQECLDHYLSGIKDNLLKALPLFMTRNEALGAQEGDPPPLYLKMKLIESFKPNVVSCSTCGSGEKFPIVYEKDPTWENLLGTVQEPAMIIGGRDIPLDRHKNIKGGSILKAQGGYLVVDLMDAARSGSLGGLLRAVRTGKLQIEPPGWSSNRPEAIPLNVKVVVLDKDGLYDYIAAVDRTFEESFMKAPYDPAPKAAQANMHDFVGNVLARAQEEKLRSIAPSGMAALMEHALFEIGSKDRFRADLASAMDLVREANVFAQGEKQEVGITADHIRAALEARKLRHGMRQDRMHEVIHDGIIKIETDGEVVGQINGLVVTGNFAAPVLPSALEVGKGLYGEDWVKTHEKALEQAIQSRALEDLDLHLATSAGSAAYQYGLPARITATASNAKGANIVANDENSGYLGPSTLKAMEEIKGFMKSKFGEDGFPPNFEGRISFAQNYGGVDGDSATLAKTLALLSALSGLPIKQGVAITGSMEQLRRGSAQAIGGINFKIAGFFDVCQKNGLTGQQGVVMPASNIRDLMLREDIVQAVDEGKFHVWSVNSLDEAVEKLFGVAAGQRDPKTGEYPENSVYGRVEKRLKEYRQKAGPAAEAHHDGWRIAGPLTHHVIG